MSARATEISSFGYNREPKCIHCRAGETISFNWLLARTANRPEVPRDLSVFVRETKLRQGMLLRCNICSRPWYLDEQEAFAHTIAEGRLPLVLEWTERPLQLNDVEIAALRSIGRASARLYGGGLSCHKTPCAVMTALGERIDRAIISQQQHPPIEEWRRYRLASEITEIYPSPCALPFEVRKATANAQEVRMGFAPTIIVFPNGRKFTLNGTANFFEMPGCDATQIAVTGESYWPDRPPVYQQPADVTYFVADWDGEDNPGLVSSRPSIQPADAMCWQSRLWRLLRFKNRF
jgi:hypothetical protein